VPWLTREALVLSRRQPTKTADYSG